MRVIFLILIGFSSLSFAEFSRQNGVVTDSSPKLEWQDDYGDNGEDLTNMTWQDAIGYCKDLSLDGGGWRVPNIRELESLIKDYSNPSINSIFELTSLHRYWSTTVYDNSPDGAYVVNFRFKLHTRPVGYSFKDKNNYVRCVRGKVLEL